MKKYREKWGEGKERVSGRKERERLREISRKGKREEIYVTRFWKTRNVAQISKIELLVPGNSPVFAGRSNV